MPDGHGAEVELPRPVDSGPPTRPDGVAPDGVEGAEPAPAGILPRRPLDLPEEVVREKRVADSGEVHGAILYPGALIR